MHRLVFFLIAMMAVAAQAQVIRCTNPKTGQVTDRLVCRGQGSRQVRETEKSQKA